MPKRNPDKDVQRLAALAKRLGLSLGALQRVTGLSRRRLSVLFTTCRAPHAATFIAIGHSVGLRVLPQLGVAIDINVLPEALAGEAKRRGYTVSELASKSGLHKTQVSRLLGQASGNWPTCRAVMHALQWRLLWPKISKEAARQSQIENERY